MWYYAILAILILVSFEKSVSANHVLQFANSYAVVPEFRDFPTTNFTFEAWIRTQDDCHPGATLMSYAMPSESGANDDLAQADYNHFVVVNPKSVIACKDYQYIYPVEGELDSVSCSAGLWDVELDPLVAIMVDDDSPVIYTRDGTWNHLAITYQSLSSSSLSTSSREIYQIFVNGMLSRVASKSVSDVTVGLRQGGSFMLGSDQDCVGGCTNPEQAFYGAMDEVRIWSTVRTQDEILRDMHTAGDVNIINNRDLVAYWDFDQVTDDGKIVDITGKNHDLSIRDIPVSSKQLSLDNKPPGDHTALSMHNSWAINTNIVNMPDANITIEFWGRTRSLNSSSSRYEQPGFFSFATVEPGDGDVENDLFWLPDAGFLADALAISKHMSDWWSKERKLDRGGTASTLGAISFHVNDFEFIFLTNWTDSKWHHVAATWVKETGEAILFFDGQELVPFWGAFTAYEPHLKQALQNDPDNTFYSTQKEESPSPSPSPSPSTYDSYYYDDYYYDYYYDDYYDDFSDYSSEDEEDDYYDYSDVKDYKEKYFGEIPVKNSNRSKVGSLVLGQLQRNYGGGFFPRLALSGDMAVLRVWDRALSQSEIKQNMDLVEPTSRSGLVMMYDMKIGLDGQSLSDSVGSNTLSLGGYGPKRMLQMPPLQSAKGTPLPTPETNAGYAIRLNDQVTLIKSNFENFPSTNLSLEFWMKSSDVCRFGTPFSYALFDTFFSSRDNSFSLINYNDWMVYVMNDNGFLGLGTSGVSATDGDWHHIVVTWSNEEGETALYQDSHLVWRTQRGKSQIIPSGGTLVVGREQDCKGGCFDSAIGASGDVDTGLFNRQDSQDFYGLMDDMRLWNRTLSSREVFIHYQLDAQRYLKSGTFKYNYFLIQNKTGLVANWTFDEGDGYVVRDMTGNGNDLYISGNPTFEAMIMEEYCGNGFVESRETCDDGNLAPNDGCSAECRVEFGWTCTPGSPSVCTPISSLPDCGNGKMEGAEQCDDGNKVSGDGCSQTCHVENGWECTPTSPSVCQYQGRKLKLDGVEQSRTATLNSQTSEDSNSSGGNKSSSISPLIIVIIVLIALIVIILVSFVAFRQRIYDQFPWVERKVQDIDGKLRRFRHPVTLDLDELDKAGDPVNPAAAQSSSYVPPVSSGQISVKEVPQPPAAD